MVTFFCPGCWEEITGEDKKCHYCGADITEHEKKGFEEKLINALNHPERETVQRAVWILGKLRSTGAAQPLTNLFDQTYDPFLKRAILNALDEIGTEDAVDFIMKALCSNITIVRKRAQKILERQKDR